MILKWKKKWPSISSMLKELDISESSPNSSNKGRAINYNLKESIGGKFDYSRAYHWKDSSGGKKNP